MLVNEALVKKLGWSEPLGQRVSFGPQSGRVVGVVKDFHYKSLHHLVEPLVITRFDNDMSQVSEMNRSFQQRLLILAITGREVQPGAGPCRTRDGQGGSAASTRVPLPR